MHDWELGTPADDWTSMGVVSDGSYGVPEGLISSFPVTFDQGNWEIVQGLEVNDFSRTKIDASVKELADETREATSQVKAVVQEIQSAINATVMATGETTAEVDRGAQLAMRSGEAIDEIVERVQGIHVATQQQLAGSEQVVNAMRDIQEVVRQSAAGSQQAAEAAARLEEIASQLGAVISRLSHDYEEKKG